MKELKYFRIDNYKTFLEVDCKKGEIFTNLNSNIDNTSWDAWAVGRDHSLLTDNTYLHKFHTKTDLENFYYADRFDKAYYRINQNNDSVMNIINIIKNTLLSSKEAYFKFEDVHRSVWESFIKDFAFKVTELEDNIVKAESGYPIHYIPIEKLKYMTECSFFPHPNAKNCTDFFDRHDSWRQILQSGENVPEKTIIEERINSVYNSIKENGMKNPLIVKDGLDGFFYVVIGNQRLTVQKALGRVKSLPCRISPRLDPWDVNTHVLKLHHYEKIEGI